jgi:hypothetical protein
MVVVLDVVSLLEPVVELVLELEPVAVLVSDDSELSSELDINVSVEESASLSVDVPSTTGPNFTMHGPSGRISAASKSAKG